MHMYSYHGTTIQTHIPPPKKDPKKAMGQCSTGILDAKLSTQSAPFLGLHYWSGLLEFPSKSIRGSAVLYVLYIQVFLYLYLYRYSWR